MEKFCKQFMERMLLKFINSNCREHVLLFIKGHNSFLDWTGV